MSLASNSNNLDLRCLPLEVLAHVLAYLPKASLVKGRVWRVSRAFANAFAAAHDWPQMEVCCADAVKAGNVLSSRSIAVLAGLDRGDDRVDVPSLSDGKPSAPEVYDRAVAKRCGACGWFGARQSTSSMPGRTRAP